MMTSAFVLQCMHIIRGISTHGNRGIHSNACMHVIREEEVDRWLRNGWQLVQIHLLQRKQLNIVCCPDGRARVPYPNITKVLFEESIGKVILSLLVLILFYKTTSSNQWPWENDMENKYVETVHRHSFQVTCEFIGATCHHIVPEKPMWPDVNITLIA